MKYIIALIFLSTLLSCNSDDSSPSGEVRRVVNLEQINKKREELVHSWENWIPQSRNQRDVIVHGEGETLESLGDDGLSCHYLYNSVTYTTVWNREAETYDLSREFSGLTLGSETTEEEEVCLLRANTSGLGDSLGMALIPMALLYMDQTPTNGGIDFPFEELRPLSLEKKMVGGIQNWTLTYFIRGSFEDLDFFKIKSLKSIKRNQKFNGTISFTFASEVPFPAWLLKMSYSFNLSDGTAFGGEEKQVLFINGRRAQ